MTQVSSYCDTFSCDTTFVVSVTVGSQTSTDLTYYKYDCPCDSNACLVEGIDDACTDYDECSAGADNCDTNAECLNSFGSFECKCNDFYSGDGKIAIPLLIAPWNHIPRARTK
jgi:hypothetical protein